VPFRIGLTHCKYRGKSVHVTGSVDLYRVNRRRKVEQVCSLCLNPTKAVNAKSQRGKDAARHSRNQKDRIHIS
jgi:hypothetical protein